jgi:hypothetical protein
MTLICLCPSENSVSELITFLVLDQDVLYTEELESLPHVTCESFESHEPCVSGISVGQAWEFLSGWVYDTCRCHILRLWRA